MRSGAAFAVGNSPEFANMLIMEPAAKRPCGDAAIQNGSWAIPAYSEFIQLIDHLRCIIFANIRI
jgi:hypothetical protein